jgi:hypothetical protein
LIGLGIAMANARWRSLSDAPVGIKAGGIAGRRAVSALEALARRKRRETAAGRVVWTLANADGDYSIQLRVNAETVTVERRTGRLAQRSRHGRGKGFQMENWH